MDQTDFKENWLDFDPEEDEKDLETPKLCIDETIEYKERAPPPRKPYKSAFEIIQERHRNRKQQQQDAKIPSSVKMSPNHEIKSPYAFLPATRPLLSCGIRFDYNSHLISNKQQENAQETQADLHCEPLKDAFRHLGVLKASRALQIERELVFEPTAEEIEKSPMLSTQQQQHHTLSEKTEGSTKVVDERRAQEESLEKELNNSLQLLTQKLDTSASGAQLIDHVLDCSFRKKEDLDTDDEILKLSTQQLENAYLELANDRTAKEEKNPSCDGQEPSMSSFAKKSSPIASTTATINHLAPRKYIGFSLATGKILPVDQGVISEIQLKFDQAEKKMKLTEVIETSCNLGDTTMQSPKTPLTTSTPIVEHGLRKRPRSIFHQPAKDDDADPPATQIDLDYVDKLERDYRAKLAKEEKAATTIVEQENIGFAFASGRKVSLNQDAITNIKQQFDRAEKNMKLNEVEDSSCNLGQSIASTSLATPARSLKRSLENETTPQNFEFAFASGKSLPVDQGVISEIQLKFDQAEKKMKLTEVTETSCNLGDTTMQSPKTPLTTSTPIVAHGSRKGPRNIFHQPAKNDDDVSPPDTQIDLDYVDTLEREFRAKLAEDEKAASTIVEQENIGFAFASGRRVSLNQDAIFNIKQQFDRAEKNMKLNEDSSCNLGQSIASPPTTPLATPVRSLKRPLKNETTPQNFGFAFASGKSVSVNQGVISEIQLEFDQAEKKMKLTEVIETSCNLGNSIKDTTMPKTPLTASTPIVAHGSRKGPRNIFHQSAKDSDAVPPSDTQIDLDYVDGLEREYRTMLAEKENISFGPTEQQRLELNDSSSSHIKTKSVVTSNTVLSEQLSSTQLSLPTSGSWKDKFPKIGRSSDNLSGDFPATQTKVSSSTDNIAISTSSTASRKEQQAERGNNSGSILLQQKKEGMVRSSSESFHQFTNEYETRSKGRRESMNTTSNVQTPKILSNETPPLRSRYGSKHEESASLLDDLPGKNVKNPKMQVPRKQSFREYQLEIWRKFDYSGKVPNYNIEPTNDELHRVCVQAEQLEKISFPRRLKWKEQCEYIQNKPDLDRRPVAGRLFTVKKTENRAKLKDYNSSRELSLKKSAIADLIPFERILHHLFDMSDYCNDDVQTKGFLTIVDNEELVLDTKGSSSVGFQEIKSCFRAMLGVDPRLVSDAWVQNAYEMIFWKFMIMEAYLDGIDKHEALNIENILLQLKYRYDREIDRNERPVLRKIVEGDEAPGRRIVLKVMRTTYSQQNGYVLELTDGWYRVLANVDACLAEATSQGKICAHSKLLIANMECLASAESKGILEHSSLPRVKLHGNSTRRVKWTTKMGCCRFPQPFQTALGSVKADGGVIGQLKLVITHVYNPIYIEFDGDRKEFRSEKKQNRINDLNETNLCAMYDRIRSKVIADLREELRKRYIVHKQTFKATGGGLSLSEIAEVLEFECESSFAQTVAGFLTDRNRNKLNELHAQRRYELDEKIKRLMKLEDKRKVTQLLKFRVADANDPKSSTLVSWWHPPEELFDIVKVGRMILLYRARAERAQGNMIISAREDAVIREVKAKPDLTKFKAHFRHHTKLSDLDENFAPQHDEFDIACVVLHIGEAQQGKFPSQEVFAVDEEMDFVCLKFHINIAEYAYDDVLKEGKILYIRNLQWRRSFRNLNTEMPEAYAVTDTTTFVTSSRRESEGERLIELEQAIAKHPNFFEECRKKLVNLIGSVDFRNMQNSGMRRIPKLIKTPPPKIAPSKLSRFEA